MARTYRTILVSLFRIMNMETLFTNSMQLDDTVNCTRAAVYKTVARKEWSARQRVLDYFMNMYKKADRCMLNKSDIFLSIVYKYFYVHNRQRVNVARYYMRIISISQSSSHSIIDSLADGLTD